MGDRQRGRNFMREFEYNFMYARIIFPVSFEQAMLAFCVAPWLGATAAPHNTIVFYGTRWHPGFVQASLLELLGTACVWGGERGLLHNEYYRSSRKTRTEASRVRYTHAKTKRE